MFDDINAIVPNVTECVYKDLTNCDYCPYRDRCVSTKIVDVRTDRCLA